MFAYPSQRLQDWVSQQWCIFTGRRYEPGELPWLEGPFGDVDQISDEFPAELARRESLGLTVNAPGAGLLPAFDVLNLPPSDLGRIHPEIPRFYTRTRDYTLDVWSRWNVCFRPVAGLLVAIYSRRLQQMNLPLDPLDTAQGMSSDILQFHEAGGSEPKYTLWLRRLNATGHVAYAGIYSTCTPPGHPTCVKTVFPLPRGNATFIMRPTVRDDGSLLLSSQGRRFGDPGFYFLLRDGRGGLHARYNRHLKEAIRVFVDASGELRGDHIVNFLGVEILRLHYRINRAAE